MPQSLANILIHLVFSTKDRNRWISEIWRDDLHGYIANQREHHTKISFQDEYRKLLAKYGIAYDERYVWD